MSSTTHALLEATDLDIEIGGTTLLRDARIHIARGQSWCILGRNGSGKTTLLHTLAGLRPPRSGVIRLAGTPLDTLSRRQIARHLGLVFQDQFDAFPASVLECVLQGRHPHLHSWQWESAEDERIALEALAQVGLQSLALRDVRSLSGGERQRVAIAALICQQAEVLLLDEPSNHLDLNHRLFVLDTLVKQCRSSGKALIMSLHDINLAARLADHVMLLHGDGETSQGPRETVLTTPALEALYGHPLTQVRTERGPAWLPR